MSFDSVFDVLKDINSANKKNLDKNNVRLHDGDAGDDNSTYEMRTLLLFRNEATTDYTTISPSFTNARDLIDLLSTDGSWYFSSSDDTDLQTLSLNVLMADGTKETRSIDLSGNSSILVSPTYMHLISGKMDESGGLDIIGGDIYMSKDSSTTDNLGIPDVRHISGVMRKGFGKMTSNYIQVLIAQKIYPVDLTVSNQAASTEFVNFRLNARSKDGEQLIIAEFQIKGGESKSFDLSYLDPIGFANDSNWTLYPTVDLSSGDTPYILANLSVIIK